ncbi:MAG: hypothetical protein GX811_03745 [Lentisphaerae bacterium]|nr:hypothetical protein [Lentisphaerota bacterium]
MRAMNPECLACQRLIGVVVYPPLAIQPVDSTQMYAELTSHYPYQSFQHLPDGARMANPDSDLFIQVNRVQVNENVQYFPAAKEKCVDIFGMVQRRFGIQQFLNLGVKLLAFLPMENSESAADFIHNNILSGIKDKLDLLGHGRQGSGIRVRLQKDGVHDLRIEPFFNDLSQLYIELDVQYPYPFSDLGLVEPRLDAAYDYLFGEVKSFLSSLNS